MKITLLIFILLCFSCNTDKSKKFVKTKTITINKKDSSDSTELLIAPFRITPELEIKEIDSNKQVFKFDKHTLIVFLMDNKYICSIDGKKIDYSSSVTINEVVKKVDSLNWTTYSVENIKYYKKGIEEKLLITLQSDPCNGTGCSVNNFLIYDLKNGAENYFGAYNNYSNKTGNFYDLNEDGKFEFIGQSYPNDLICSGNCLYFFKVFSEDGKGNFIPKLDDKKHQYFLKSTEDGAIISSNWF